VMQDQHFQQLNVQQPKSLRIYPLLPRLFIARIIPVSSLILANFPPWPIIRTHEYAFLLSLQPPLESQSHPDIDLYFYYFRCFAIFSLCSFAHSSHCGTISVSPLFRKF
jgi:hypothetical protein